MRARAELEDDASHAVVSHGHWHLKGVDAPIELFQVAPPGEPLQPPPDTEKVYRVVRRGALWIPLRDLRHSLPAERSPFSAANRCCRDLALRFFTDHNTRLVSLLGTGGMGKTGSRSGSAGSGSASSRRRVVLRPVAGDHARRHRPGRRRRAWASRSGRTIRSRPSGGRSPGGRCLLILDNFEQVVAR